MKKSIFYLNILAFILFFAAEKIEAVEVSAFEQTYFRGTGTPVTETSTFHKINGLAKIRVTNGGLEDDVSEMVSSSEIALNGEVIIDASNFNQNVGIIEVEIYLSGGINTIEVILKGKPGGALTVQVLAEEGDIDFDDDNFTGNEGDCNDEDNEINPDSQEVCDGVDNNCDGQIDEGVKTTFYHDVDNDGYGNLNDTTEACEQPSGYVTDNTDCNDSDSNEHPNQTWYKDEDGDLYSDGTTDTTSCARPFGYKTEEELTATSGDCDDNDANEHPGQTWYKDVDGDLYSDGMTDTVSCVRPTWYKIASELTATTGDCNDDDSSINPAAQEVCDGLDNNCDGTVDEGLTFDLDGDGFTSSGSCEGTRDDCDDDDADVNPGKTEVLNNGKDDDCNPATPDDDLDNDGYNIVDDCDDNDPSVNPGMMETPYNGKDDDCNSATPDDDLDGDGFINASDCNDNDSSIFPGATETPYDGIDQDCDGSDLIDADGDGHDAEQAGGDDCNDNSALINPGVIEVAYDGIDQDCDGSDLVDVDGDGHSAVQAGGDDCDDNNPNIHPGATDIYENGIDEDCDGQDAIDPNNTDDDGDGFTENQGDCDDTKPEVNPDATEILDNNIDDNCNGEVDEDTVPPLVTITSPITFTTVGVSPVTVTGTVDDPDATVTVNGVNAAIENGAFSVPGITLTEGGNTITVTAIDPANNVSTAHVTIYMDSTPPNVTINTPEDGYVSTSNTVSIAGTIYDIVKGTVNEENASVAVNGVTAAVSNKTFMVEDLVLVEGGNTITAIAADQVGNTASAGITVFVDTSAQKKINMVSGNNQTATINTKLSSPFVISLTNEDGTPAEGKTVIFKITRNNGVLEGSSGTGQVLAETTDANGQASVYLTTGSRSGVGNNRVEAYSVGFEGDVIFTASALQSAPYKINIGSGNNQRGAIGMSLPNPLVAVVTDVGHNVIQGALVTFTVTGGGGIVDGTGSVVVNTDSDGRATISFTLGDEEGLDNHVVQAGFEGITTAAAIFRASGFVTGDPGDTSISGVVMDNSNIPIPGVTLRVEGTTREAVSDDEGQFLIENVPVGPLHLIVDGSTATVSGEYPVLSFEIDTISGQNNTLGMPIYLLPLNTTNTRWVGGNDDVVYELENIPGFSLKVRANSVTFPDGSNDGFISVTQVHADKVPMEPPNGLQPRFIITIQPPGAVFDPPAPITIPNVDGLAPGEITEMYSFDHDLGQFVSIGTGTVSEDGMVLASDPGVGIIKAGWHCGGNPVQPGTGIQLALESIDPSGEHCTCSGAVVKFTATANAPGIKWKVDGEDLGSGNESYDVVEGPTSEGNTSTVKLIFNEERPNEEKPNYKVTAVCEKGSPISESVTVDTSYRAEFDESKVNQRNLYKDKDNQNGIDKSAMIIWEDYPGQIVDLKYFLTQDCADLIKEENKYIVWKVDGNSQESNEHNYGLKPDPDKINSFEIEAFCGSNTEEPMDRMILVVVPVATKIAFDNWYNIELIDTRWLDELPYVYSSLEDNNSNPEPPDCNPQLWDNVKALNSYYHPEANLQMRSLFTERFHGHQATYQDNGNLFRSGVSAGTADKASPDVDPFAHRDNDAIPFVWAAQLDGNPVEGNLTYINLTAPLMYEDKNLEKYLQVRPVVWKGRELEKGTCNPDQGN